MEALRTFQKPLDRQIEEALRIKNSQFDILMNSETEWRIDSVPRARFTAPGLRGGETGEKKFRSLMDAVFSYWRTDLTVNLEFEIFF